MIYCKYIIARGKYVMDYNYVRMRKAASMGDMALAEQYRKLFEAGIEQPSETDVMNYIILLLAVVAISLGIYIAFSNSGTDVAALLDTVMV